MVSCPCRIKSNIKLMKEDDVPEDELKARLAWRERLGIPGRIREAFESEECEIPTDLEWPVYRTFTGLVLTEGSMHTPTSSKHAESSALTFSAFSKPDDVQVRS